VSVIIKMGGYIEKCLTGQAFFKYNTKLRHIAKLKNFCKRAEFAVVRWLLLLGCARLTEVL